MSALPSKSPAPAIFQFRSATVVSAGALVTVAFWCGETSQRTPSRILRALHNHNQGAEKRSKCEEVEGTTTAALCLCHAGRDDQVNRERSPYRRRGGVLADELRRYGTARLRATAPWLGRAGDGARGRRLLWPTTFAPRT